MPPGNRQVTAGCQKIGDRGVLSSDVRMLSPTPALTVLDTYPGARAVTPPEPLAFERPGAAHAELEATSPDEDRFDVLFRTLYPGLHGLTYRVLADRAEAEDVLQEAFLRLASSASVLARPDGEVGAWLRRVCLNLAFNRLRDRRRADDRVARLGASASTPGSDEGSPASAAVRREERAAVRAALARLPERQRACLLLRHSGYAYAEIAATLGIATGSVGVLLARAERAFRSAYGAAPDLS